MRGISKAQETVLSVLVPGGHLTVEQIATQGEIRGISVRIAICELRGRGAITAGPFGTARYRITDFGRGLAFSLGLARSSGVV
ncbi:hypothetical protein GFY24_00795 [Nocardia sp. SYP-A9097]|uniref:hypothetical protein n=1 Tax=Nocardia sp. SYP-A9097 TaxID=2663237 RepID=UPI00129BFA33|nr:hypothetical protein [Nocardia sp. SYP-A9097]MRH86015.1 hypothetical protein [Nocardia sp. SYP-A9097]